MRVRNTYKCNLLYLFSENIDKQAINEILIDFINVPLKPISKEEIQQLKMYLTIETLYSHEIIELTEDSVRNQRGLIA